MNDEILRKISAAVLLVFGAWFALQHNKLAHETANFYDKLIGIRISENWYRFPYLIVGVFFAVFGLLGILGIIRLT